MRAVRYNSFAASNAPLSMVSKGKNNAGAAVVLVVLCFIIILLWIASKAKSDVAKPLELPVKKPSNTPVNMNINMNDLYSYRRKR